LTASVKQQNAPIVYLQCTNNESLHIGIHAGQRVQEDSKALLAVCE
jgi:hypothetical protein